LKVLLKSMRSPSNPIYVEIMPWNSMESPLNVYQNLDSLMSNSCLNKSLHMLGHVHFFESLFLNLGLSLYKHLHRVVNFRCKIPYDS
jgi:hypothetical protein